MEYVVGDLTQTDTIKRLGNIEGFDKLYIANFDYK